ncbi:MAG: PIN domain nuclease [Candidatus Eremiobacteraeota bacterium]|nr:PIN domain nuclease [Candidatus Eremiobacteraeota bacterium]
MMNRFIRGMFYFVFTVFGGMVGMRVAQYNAHYYLSLSEKARMYNLWAMIGVGALVGIIIAPYTASLFLKIVDKVVLSLQRLTLQEVILGAIGLIFGLIISFFFSIPVNVLPLDEIPMVGIYLKPILVFFITIFFSYLGVYFGTRTVVVHNFGHLFTAPGKTLTSRLAKGYKILDTSVIIDGRIADISKSGFIEGNMLVPKFILDEVQQLADSADSNRRNRGRRGLDILHWLREHASLEVWEKDYADLAVDGKLIKLAQELGGILLTTDYNLNKVAQLQGIKVLNINELANALKPVVLPGESMKITIIKEGKEANQGVGYLDDGTMVVVENARRNTGEQLDIEVTSVIQTVAGKMIFAKKKQEVN